MLLIEDLSTLEYRKAWALQEAAHEQVVAGGPERVLLVEHPPVITFGRRPEAAVNLLASAEHLENLGVDLVESDRGGDITYHAPGQLVAYPIIRLNDHALSVGGYVRAMENCVIDAVGKLGVTAHRVSGAVGVWTGDSKLCAIGVRIRRGVSTHGLALNVDIDLSGFDLIVPCGLAGKSVTSLKKILGDKAPSMAEMKRTLADALQNAFATIDSTT